MEGTYVIWTFLGATFFKEENEIDKISFNNFFFDPIYPKNYLNK